MGGGLRPVAREAAKGAARRKIAGGRIPEPADEDVADAEADHRRDDSPQQPEVEAHEQQQREHHREDSDP